MDDIDILLTSKTRIPRSPMEDKPVVLPPVKTIEVAGQKIVGYEFEQTYFSSTLDILKIIGKRMAEEPQHKKTIARLVKEGR